MPDAPKNSTDPLHTLDYAAPRRRLPWRAHPALVLVVATLLGLFALLMLACAIFGVVYILRHGKRANREKDLFECTMFLIIGAFSAIIALRWLKIARRDLPNT